VTFSALLEILQTGVDNFFDSVKLGAPEAAVPINPRHGVHKKNL